MNHVALLDEYQNKVLDKKLEPTDLLLLRDSQKKVHEFHNTILDHFNTVIDSGITIISDTDSNSTISTKETKRAYNRRVKAVGKDQEALFKIKLGTTLEELANTLITSFDIKVRKAKIFQVFLFTTFINGYTQTRTSHLLGINQGTVSRWIQLCMSKKMIETLENSFGSKE